MNLTYEYGKEKNKKTKQQSQAKFSRIYYIGEFNCVETSREREKEDETPFTKHKKAE
jgi:hypothetical protein